MEQKKNITNSFVASLLKAFSADKVLYLNVSDLGIFSDTSRFATFEVRTADGIPEDEHFDLVVGDLLLGMGRAQWSNQKRQINFKPQKNWVDLFKSLFSLTDEGCGIFLVEPHAFRTNQGYKFIEELNNHGFYINAVFNTPERILVPATLIQPVIVLVSRVQSDNLFIAELFDTTQVEQVISNFIKHKDTADLARGIFVSGSVFKSFYNYKISKQLERLETQYKEYESYELETLSKEINTVKSGDKFEELENTIYIPKIGKSKVFCQLNEGTLKHHNCFQVVLDEAVVNNKYIALFFSSTLGRLVLDSLLSGTIIPHINKSDLKVAIVPIPALNEQKTIIQTAEKMQNLRLAIGEFETELSLNPKSSRSIQPQLENMLASINMLTDADRVRALIREGETKNIEFKQTLSVDIKTQEKKKYIELSVLKTIVGFLNTNDGSLLVGVKDDGHVYGVDKEIEKHHKKNKDKFLLHFKNIVKSRIGEEFYPSIEYSIVDVDEKMVLVVECVASKIPCYLDRRDFYVRINPATDKLEGPTLVEYIKQHFDSE